MSHTGAIPYGPEQHCQPPVSLSESGKEVLFLIRVIPGLGLIIGTLGFIPDGFINIPGLHPSERFLPTPR